MLKITEQDVAANHLRVAGHLPDWVPGDQAQRKCSVCGVTAGFQKSWTVNPAWSKR